jgi:kindlin 2
MNRFLLLAGDQDWSDHALWWPDKKKWLLQPRITLNAYGVQSDARLQFTPQRKPLKVQLPDRMFREIKCSFSVMVFDAVMELCEQLGIRHPEEMSLIRAKSHPRIKKDDQTDGSPAPSSLPTVEVTGDYPDGLFGDTLARTTEERASLNSLWLDSTKSLAEQDMQGGDPVQLKFKYHAFMNIDPKFDDERINQLYEQAKWSILSEDVDCTEEEALQFAALQLQVKLASAAPPPSPNAKSPTIDQAISELQQSPHRSPQRPQPSDVLGGLPSLSSKKLSGYLRYYKPSKFSLVKSYKKFWFVFQDTHISYYKSKEEASGRPALKVKLTGAEVTPEVNVAKKKFGIKVDVPSIDGMGQFYLLCDDENEYAEWMAACQLASKGKTLDDPSYESELSGVRAFLTMQSKHDDTTEVSPNDFVSQRILKKLKSQKVAEMIWKHHAKVNQLPELEAKLQYIRSWEALMDYGISYFIVRFSRAKKDELLGITYNRMIRMDINTHEHKQTWRYSAMHAWNINWEIKEMKIEHEDGNFSFSCSSADLKIVHEYIGGYIFLSMRQEQDEDLDTEMFLKLTGGWHQTSDPTVLPSAN